VCACMRERRDRERDRKGRDIGVAAVFVAFAPRVDAPPTVVPAGPSTAAVIFSTAIPAAMCLYVCLFV